MKRMPAMVAATLMAAACVSAQESALRLPLNLDRTANGKPLTNAVAPGIALAPGALVPGSTVTLAGVSFAIGSNLLDVAGSMSGIQEIVRVKPYLDGKNLATNGRLGVRIPGDQHQALYLLAFSRKFDDAVPRLTVRIGLFGGMSGILHDEVAQVPDITEATPSVPGILATQPVELAGGGKGYLHLVRVPLEGSANVREAGTMDIEFTRDLNVRVNLPDPNEFGLMPLGHPSGVVIMGATLERSPVAMTHDSAEAGNVFHESQRPAFTVTLSNRLDRAVEGSVTVSCEGPGTEEEKVVGRAAWQTAQPFSLAARQEKSLLLSVQPPSRLRGWYAAKISLTVGGVAAQRRDTTFAVLAPDTRKAFDESPFGIWEFWRPHSVFYQSNQVDKIASLIKKGGWRWTYGGVPDKSGGRYGESMTPGDYKALFTNYGFRMTAQSLPRGYQRDTGWFDAAEFASNEAPALVRMRERGYDNAVKVLHESRSSNALLRRFSEFLGGEEYAMPADEKARLEKQFENVKLYCAAIKKADPQARIVLINDYPHVAIEFLKRGFPPELFDVIGLECAGFMREPERQPDWLSLLGHAEIMRRAFKKYGYQKDLWTTEALYHATNPGNLSFHAQGVIAVREHLLALANGFKKLAAAGILKDPSDDYHWSNWGASGYCFRDPEINPKPSYAMLAWLTQVLDQAVFERVVETGSTAMYMLDFRLPNGDHVYPVWTVRGAQRTSFRLVPLGRPVVKDVYGNTVAAAPSANVLELLVTDTPLYITCTGALVTAVADRLPVEQPRATGARLLDCADPSKLAMVDRPNPVLERNWDFPRLKGDFTVAYESADGDMALKVELKPDGDGRKLFQRYVELALAEPVALEGRPDALHVRVRGNGGWGRVMLELIDAKGRIWTSCGNQYAGSCNASDNRGESFISFDGWHTLRIPLVRQYEGSDQFVMAPATCDWWPENTPELPAAEAKFKADTAPTRPAFRWMGVAGVDYPVRLTKLIVAMPPAILYGAGERPVEKPAIWLDKVTY